MLGPSGRGAAVLVKKALPLGAMPATHAKARMGGVMRDTVRARRGGQTQCAHSDFETVESTSVSSKVLPFAGRRRTEIYGRSSTRRDSPTPLHRRSVTRVLESRNYEEGSSQSASPSLGSLGPRGSLPSKGGSSS